MIYHSTTGKKPTGIWLLEENDKGAIKEVSSMPKTLELLTRNDCWLFNVVNFSLLKGKVTTWSESKEEEDVLVLEVDAGETVAEEITWGESKPG